MRRFLLGVVAFAWVVVALPPAQAGGVSAESAFEQLKTMAGTWTGEIEGEGEEAEAEAEGVGPAVHRIELSAGGSVVMETMGPDTPHEMINMYHLDGDDLVLTHYCSGGNQPQMRLDLEASTADRLIFDYAGGTNHDPEVDQHIHSAELQVTDEAHVISKWSAHAGGEKVGEMTFYLERSE